MSIPEWLRDKVRQAGHDPDSPETSRRVSMFYDGIRRGLERTERADQKASEEMLATMKELEALTTDDGITAAVRAAKVYLSAVRHVAAGGSVVFRDADGSEKTLKVRLR